MMKFTHDTRTHARGKIDFLLILYIFNHKERKENSLLGQPKPIFRGYKWGYKLQLLEFLQLYQHKWWTPPPPTYLV